MMQPMNWDDVQVFLAIARHGTLGAAGRALQQSQPTMGRRLKALEHALGHTLFQRTSEGFVLTDEGAAVLRHAEVIEAQALSFSYALGVYPGAAGLAELGLAASGESARRLGLDPYPHMLRWLRE